MFSVSKKENNICICIEPLCLYSLQGSIYSLLKCFKQNRISSSFLSSIIFKQTPLFICVCFVMEIGMDSFLLEISF